MVDIRSIFFVLGMLLSILCIALLIPMGVDVYYNNEDWKVFLNSSLACGFIGLTIMLITHNQNLQFRTREAFIMTGLSWVLISAAAALPFYFSELNLSAADSFFESVSGITTTGSTVISGLDNAPPGILIWRAILQWLGGVGVLVMALSVLPFLNIGGMELFKLEALEDEKILPKTTQLAANIVLIYIFFTLLCFVCYRFVGMESFDAIAHSMTTISTGGFSTKDASIGHYHDYGAHFVTIIFMIIGSLPFILFLKFIRGNSEAFFKDSQVRGFFLIITVCTAITTAKLYFHHDYNLLYSFELAALNVISLITGTGYASTDYMGWGNFFIIFSFFFMMVGGCAGSTTCGIKVFRFQILISLCAALVKKTFHPHGVFIPKYNNRPITDSVSTAVLSFFFLYAFSFIVVTLCLSMTGLDYITAFSGAATSLSNVGPGLGETIGPSGNFAPLPDVSKWILSAAMILGRLEFFTILILFVPSFWKK